MQPIVAYRVRLHERFSVPVHRVSEEMVMNFHVVKIGRNKFARFFSYGQGCTANWTGEVAVQPEGYADWTEIPIRELSDEVLIWDSGRIM